MERVQPYASVDTRKRLEPVVAGERYKPVYSVDRALELEGLFFCVVVVFCCCFLL